MTLLWADGFDSRSVVASGHAYAIYSGSGVPVNKPGRFGSGPWALGTVSSSLYPYRFLNVPYSTITVGIATRSYSTDIPLVNFYSGGTQVCTFSTYYGRAAIQNYQGSWLVTNGKQISFDNTQWNFIEVKLTCGTSALMEARVNGDVVLNASGFNSGSTTVNGAGFYIYTSGVNDVAVDDFYITDGEFLGDTRVMSVLPTGNGSSSQLVGSDGNSTDNYLLVDDVPPTSTDYVGSGTVGQKDMYQYGDIATTWSKVHGVIVTPYAAKSDVGSISGRSVVTLGGNTLTGNPAALATTYAMSPTVFPAKPGGGVWTPADVNAAEYGWEVQPGDV